MEVAQICDRLAMREPAVVQSSADLVEVLVRDHQPAAAERWMEAFASQAEATRVNIDLALAARCRGLLAGRDHFTADFERALVLHDAAGSPFERARTELCFGERLRRVKRVREARDHLRAALGSFERLGARPWMERATSELRATGEVIGPPRSTVMHELTAQEIRTALLAAHGATNREIAADLFVSPKTVEVHLTAIYGKMGVRSRAELAHVLASELQTGGPT